MWKKIATTCSVISIVCMFAVQTDQTGFAMEVLEIQSEPSNQTSMMKGLKEENWSLQYKLKGQDLYVECVIPDFTLAKNQEEKGGYLSIKINSVETAKMHKAAFMLKNMPPGKHQLEILPVKYNGDNYAKGITFEVNVPER